jgi:cytochrome b561
MIIDDIAFRYDRITVLFHWLTASLVLLLWCLGQSIDYFPRGTPRIAVRSMHILLGATLE